MCVGASVVRDWGYEQISIINSGAKNDSYLLDSCTLASGFTMRVAVEALLKESSSQVVVAVPTGPSHTVQRIASNVSRSYCANIRSGMSFAVADAYKHWCDVTEQEALDVFGHL